MTPEENPLVKNQERLIKALETADKDMKLSPLGTKRYYSWELPEFKVIFIHENELPMFMPGEDYVEVEKLEENKYRLLYHGQELIVPV